MERYIEPPVRRWFFSAIKGILLAIWIGALGALAWAAIGGHVSEFVLNYRPRWTKFAAAGIGDGSGKAATPLELLELFQRSTTNAPPIAGLLDASIPGWSEPEVPILNRKIEATEYNALFERVADGLRGLVDDTHFDTSVGKIVVNFIPAPFSKLIVPAPFVLLPAELKVWIDNQRAAEKANEARKSLIDTFVLLIIIGAFGSLVFMIRDYLRAEQETRVAAYVFRPVLGIFLAVAMFIIAIAASAAVSTSDILQVRRETLCILALAAGLLSEKAYAIIDRHSRVALDGAGRNQQGERNADTPNP